MKIGRRADLGQLKQDYNLAKTSKEKEKVAFVAHSIQKEDGRIGSMREALIKAHRNQKVEEIKDIHEYIKKKPGFKSDYQKWQEREQ